MTSPGNHPRLEGGPNFPEISRKSCNKLYFFLSNPGLNDGLLSAAQFLRLLREQIWHPIKHLTAIRGGLGQTSEPTFANRESDRFPNIV